MKVIVLSDINAHFSLVNIVGLLFAMLFLLEAVCSRLDYITLPADNSIFGSKKWMLNLFIILHVSIY